MTDLTGTVAIVAGGARGIGRACALRLAELGAHVAVFDRDLAGAAEFGEQLSAPTVLDELIARSGDGLAIQADLSDQAATEAAFQQVADRWSRLDSVIIPAGGAVTPFTTSQASTILDEDLSTLINANIRSMVNCCRAAVPRLRAGGGGSIVTMASLAGVTVHPTGHLAGYGMTKAAVIQYTRYLASEVGEDGIRVNCIAPGVIRTARIIAQSVDSGNVSDGKAKGVPLRRQGEPDDVADAVEYLVGPLSKYITGQLMSVSGGTVMH
jgi:3-oxoacyl-[acyl-carrier protein] reductase